MNKLGERSLQELKGVQPDLIGVTALALSSSPVDFGVFDGSRTAEEQLELFKKGASKVRYSKHQEGKAVDLVPWVIGKYTWDFEKCVIIAQHMRDWACRTGIVIRWGGVWDKPLNVLSHDLTAEVNDYIKRRKDLGKTAFIDAVHFEVE